MANYDDSIVNAHIVSINAAEYGKDARAAMAASVERCYQLASIRAGGARNGVTSASIAEHTKRIREAVFGDEVRDALKMGLQLVYRARGISPSGTANNYFAYLENAQTGKSLKDCITTCIQLCCQEVNHT